ncbi:hypothetical protein CRV24_010016 [Beauveria bassiana]|nr:hypothetical protein CRV24_010016 [Beauveria bassiana]
MKLFVGLVVVALGVSAIPAVSDVNVILATVFDEYNYGGVQQDITSLNYCLNLNPDLIGAGVGSARLWRDGIECSFYAQTNCQGLHLATEQSIPNMGPWNDVTQSVYCS